MKNSDFEGLLSLGEKERHIKRAEYFLEGLASDMLALSARYSHLTDDSIKEKLLQEVEIEYGITKKDYDISIELFHLATRSFYRISIKEKPVIRAFLNGLEIRQLDILTLNGEEITFRERYGEPRIIGAPLTGNILNIEGV